MVNRSERGSIAIDVISFILLVLLIAVGIFAGISFKDKNHYKNDVNQIVASAVNTAKQQQMTTDQAAFAVQSKLPYKTFTGPVALGSISFRYPKSWSAYVDQTSSDQPIEGYFYPGTVPGLTSGTAYALRVELVSDDYTTVIQNITSQGQSGSLKAAAYLPPKMKKVANVQPGTLFTGAIAQDSQGNNLNGEMLVIRVRDKTLEISTQSNNFISDFNNTVLANLTFQP